MALEVSDGVVSGDGIIDFAFPACRWWDDIVFN
jgi:hypothetical protein